MAFTATIQSINYTDDQWNVGVGFADSVTGWKQEKAYMFASNSTKQDLVTAITTDGIQYKSRLAALINLQRDIGTVITI